MMNSSAKNHLMSPSHEHASGNHAPPSIKSYFKAPEGKYNLQFDKTYPTAFPHYTHGKTVTQGTVAHLSDKPMQVTNSQPVSSVGVSSGVRSAAARLLGGGNGSKALSFAGGNGGNKPLLGGDSTNSSSVVSGSSFEGKGSYLVFNVGDAIFISDLNSEDKEPIKSITFSNSNPVCHAFDPDAKDGHDLVIGMSSGDVYSVSLRQQLQDVGKKLVGAQHYNKDGVVNSSRCTCIAWIPNSDGSYIVTHGDGNMYIYEKNKDGSGDPLFPAIKDQTQFSVSHARYSKNPVARWHICKGSINAIAFSADGAYLATGGRDGYLRVFDYKREQLICGGKSYFGGLLCCAWSMDGKYVLTGGEDDLVQVWSIEHRKIIAWCEGHNSWVSGVAFDSYWSAPNADGLGENVVYRFGSVGQDTQMLLWDLELDELVVPVRRAPGGSPTFSMGSPSALSDNSLPAGSLQPAPSTRDVPKLSPLVVHRIHNEPLAGLIFTQESVLTISREGSIKIWTRPVSAVSQSSNDTDSLSNTSFKEKCTTTERAFDSGFKQKNDMVTSPAAMING